MRLGHGSVVALVYYGLILNILRVDGKAKNIVNSKRRCDGIHSLT